MKTKQALNILSKLGACQESIDYVNHYPNFLSALKDCEEGTWIICIAGKSGAYSKEELLKIILDYIQPIEKFHPEARIVKLYNTLNNREDWIDCLCDILAEARIPNDFLYLRSVLDYEKINKELEYVSTY